MEPLLVLFICVFCLLETCIKVEGRYCTFENNGELKYYVCQRNEYCCNFGCCLSPTFQFYQLWYYWLMVIFMFLLCSGGQWWYRYWLQGRYAGELGSSMPYRGGGGLPAARRPARPARVSYHPARDAVVLQQIWKPSYPGASGSRGSPPPSYNSGNAGAATSRDLIEAERGSIPGGPKPSPYFQLYGPPPSYDQVIRESRDEVVEVSELQEPTQPLVPTNPAIPQIPGAVQETNEIHHLSDSPAPRSEPPISNNK